MGKGVLGDAKFNTLNEKGNCLIFFKLLAILGRKYPLRDPNMTIMKAFWNIHVHSLPHIRLHFSDNLAKCVSIEHWNSQ